MGGVMKDDEKLNRALCKPGSKVFYWEPQHAWAVGIVEADDGKAFTVKGADYSATKVDALQTIAKLADNKLWPVRDDVLDEDVDDLLQLTVLHDSTIQRCLFIRYMKDTVYTNIGAIVVALNPWNFKIPKYMDTKMPDYLAEGEFIRNNVPHSWAQAHNTWNELRRDTSDQCILISGESGAGKTEAAKIVMKYLGALSCREGEESSKEAARKVAFNINQASPILEGFGNAKTVRNDNSSRFGKFMKVQFDTAGFLVGAFTTKYLLEKSRIVTASMKERVYHSFYLLSKGSDAGKYNLGPSASYKSCNAGQCIDIPGVDDGDDYRICVEAMHNCGFSEDNIDAIWAAVAGCLHLGMQDFKEIDKDSCEMAGDEASGKACAVWQTDAEVLKRELVTTTMTTRDGPVVKKLTKVKAADSRDSLIKTLYDTLFSWEVLAINDLTDSGTGQNFIGLLDIFGFEDFEYNSFEQLCINLANETLQNHYNNYIFQKDMDECRAEGVDVTEVVCPDNMPCLTMMTAKTGIFGLLDDECSMGTGTDDGFLNKVFESFKDKHQYFDTKKLSKNSFIVLHYAANVNYTVEGWLDKNRDTLKPAMKHFMRASTRELLAGLIPEPDENARKITVGGFFKQQLVEMMDLINSTNPHWIRCVKPHPAKKPLMVHGITMMQQLESSGVLGTVKIRKAGFPVRPTFKNFVQRFKIILGAGPPLDDVPAMKEWCKKLCDKCGIDPKKAQAGTTKMFLKTESNQSLEAARDDAQKIHRLNAQNAGRNKIKDLARRHKERVDKIKALQKELRGAIAEMGKRRQEAQNQYNQTKKLPRIPGVPQEDSVVEPEEEPEPEIEPEPEPEIPSSTPEEIPEINPFEGQFSTDRACTVCDSNYTGEEPRMAIYVCTDCDEKLCEQCWDVEHKNKKRSHHSKLLLYFECDLCTKGHNKRDKPLPALWFCTPCKLMLCKQCWHDEHKNPKRRKHNKQFLYPDGEEGVWADVTTRAQGVEVCLDKFKGKDCVSWLKKNTDRACSVCAKSEGRAALYSCEECDPRAPEKLCEDCWFNEHKNKKRRDHRRKLLLYMCDVCHDMEGRPAFHLCAECKLKLCDSCWKLEHKNPSRKKHHKGELYPALTKGASKGKSKGLLDQINRFLDKMKVKRRAEEPHFPNTEGTDGMFPDQYQPAAIMPGMPPARYDEPAFHEPMLAPVAQQHQRQSHHSMPMRGQSVADDHSPSPGQAPVATLPVHSMHMVPSRGTSQRHSSMQDPMNVAPVMDGESVVDSDRGMDTYHSALHPSPTGGQTASPVHQEPYIPTPQRSAAGSPEVHQHASEYGGPMGQSMGIAAGQSYGGGFGTGQSVFGNPQMHATASAYGAPQQESQVAPRASYSGHGAPHQTMQSQQASPTFTDPTSVEQQLAKLIWETNQPGGPVGGSQQRAPSGSGSPQGGYGSGSSPLNKARGGVDAYYRRRLLNFYQRYNVQKLPSVVSTLIQYRGHEEALFDALQKKYGAEPRDIMDDPLPHGWKQVESSRGDIFYKNVDGRKQWERPTIH